MTSAFAEPLTFAIEHGMMPAHGGHHGPCSHTANRTSPVYRPFHNFVPRVTGKVTQSCRQVCHRELTGPDGGREKDLVLPITAQSSPLPRFALAYLATLTLEV